MLTTPAESRIDRARIAGLLLAAGAGERYGQPKAMADTGSGPWVQRGIAALQGCNPILVVLGASSDQVAAALPTGVRSVLNPDFAEGMGSSLRVGLTALDAGSGHALILTEKDPALGDAAARATFERPIDAALVMLVDLPGVGPAVIQRVLAAAGPAGDVRSCLARAAFGGVPGHPVLLGANHWPGVIDAAVGDRGARDYLRNRQVKLVECGDIGSGDDVDVR